MGYVTINVKGHDVLLSKEDAHLIDLYSWCVSDGWGGTKYVTVNVRRNGKWSTVWLHRLIAGTPDGFETDHINGDGLDNRRENLRVVTHRQNALNSVKKKDAASRFKGVYYVARIDCWRARIRTDCGRKCLGYYKSEVEAAFMYDIASLELHGEFGRRNFLPLA